MLPPPAKKEPGQSLLSAIEEALATIQTNGDTTKTTEDCVGVLEQALADLRSGHLKWSDWCKLSKISAAKASQPALEDARLARMRGFKVAQKTGSMKSAFGRFKDFIVGNF